MPVFKAGGSFVLALRGGLQASAKVGTFEQALDFNR